MLVLTRKPGEQFVIGGGITVTVVSVLGNKVRLAFDAPAQVRILRGELLGRQAEPAGGAGLAETVSGCGGKDVRPPRRGDRPARGRRRPAAGPTLATGT
jgi:carbon storage regulator